MGLFPFGSCCSCSDHDGAFLWSNLGNLTMILAAITYIIAWVLIIVLIVVGIIFPLIWVLIVVPAFVWFCLDAVALGLQTTGATFHLIACMGDEGIVSAFVTFRLTKAGVGCMSFYNCVAHWVALGLMTLGVGVFVLFGPYFFSLVFFIFAILARNKDE